MSDMASHSPEEMAAVAKALSDEIHGTLQQFRTTVYKLAVYVLQQILDRYPEAREGRGGSIEVIMGGPILGQMRMGLFKIDWVQLADGRMVQAIFRMCDSKQATPVFLELPEEGDGKYNSTPEGYCGPLDTRACTTPTFYGLLEFVDKVVCDLPAVLDHFEVWSATKMPA